MSNDPNASSPSNSSWDSTPNESDQQRTESWEDLLEETQQSAHDPQFTGTLQNFVSSYSDLDEPDIEAVQNLVRLVLSWRFPKRKFSQECIEWIAEILFFDPPSRQRIISLWNLARN